MIQISTTHKFYRRGVGDDLDGSYLGTEILLLLGGNKFLVIDTVGDYCHNIYEIVEYTFEQIEKFTNFEPINDELLFNSNCRLVDSTKDRS